VLAIFDIDFTLILRAFFNSTCRKISVYLSAQVFSAQGLCKPGMKKQSAQSARWRAGAGQASFEDVWTGLYPDDRNGLSGQAAGRDAVCSHVVAVHSPLVRGFFYAHRKLSITQECVVLKE
jgi:hypothetical protein